MREIKSKLLVGIAYPSFPLPRASTELVAWELANAVLEPVGTWLVALTLVEEAEIGAVPPEQLELAL